MTGEDGMSSETGRLREMIDMRMSVFAEQIRKLGELRDEGLLTEEEFATKKAQLLQDL